MNTSSPWRISLQAWVSLLALGVVLWLIFHYTWLIVEVTTILFGACLITLAIRPLANRAAHQRVPRAVTVLYVYLGLGLIVALLASLLRPVVATEIDSLHAAGPQLLEQALGVLRSIPLVGQWIPDTATLTREVVGRISAMSLPLWAVVRGVGNRLLDAFVALVLAFFFTTDAGLGRRLLEAWIPQAYWARVAAFGDDLSGQLTRWVWAQLGVAFYFAVTFGVGLALLRVPFAFTIGLVGGALEIIPYVGGLVAVTLAVLSALTVNPLLAVWAVLLHLVVSFIEGHVIAPAFFGRVIGLHPAVVLVALLVGAKAAGIVGVLFAVPTAVVVSAAMHALRDMRTAQPASYEGPLR